MFNFRFMQLFDNFAHVRNALNETAGSVVTIGVFDGLHRGHQALIDRTTEQAKARGLTSLIITFSEHPLSILAPPYCPKRLLSAPRRRQLFSELGVEMVAEVAFTEGFSNQSPEEFVENLLVPLCKPNLIVCGYDFAFGKAGAGKTTLLTELGAKHGFDVDVMAPVTDGEMFVKSTMIRDLLFGGDVVRAAHMLTRPYELNGVVTTGFGRGRTIGFPTANVLPPSDRVIPARGVYLCVARVSGDPKVYAAVCNIGFNPTFEGHTQTIEAHLLDADVELPGRELSLFFLARLRDEQKFPGVDALVAQLNHDVSTARELLAQPHHQATLKGVSRLTSNDA